jgi:hypothetical protein
MLNGMRRSVRVRDWVNGLGRVEKTPTVLKPFLYFDHTGLSELP